MTSNHVEALTKAVQTGTLNLRQSNLNELPIEIFYIHEFTPEKNGWWELIPPHTLLLEHNQLKTLQPTNKASKTTNIWINGWCELIALHISYNEISMIPMAILQLPHLSIIHAHHNLLSSFILTSSSNPNSNRIQSESQNIINLMHIELQNNNLQTIDENIGVCCPNIQYLDISYNKLQSLPSSLSNCSKLEILNARNNILQGHMSIDFSKCLLLKECEMSCNRLTSVHPSLFNLPLLSRLALHQNRIQSIFATEMNDTQKSNGRIIDIFLGCNQLQNFPFTEFAQTQSLQSLKFLDLSNNKLRTLHSDIYKSCPSLEKLDISGNNLENLPSELALIENIQNIIIDGNPLRRINKSVLNSNNNGRQQSLISYLKQRLTVDDDVGDDDDGNDDVLNEVIKDLSKLILNKHQIVQKCNQSLPMTFTQIVNYFNVKCKQSIKEQQFFSNLIVLELDENKLQTIDSLIFCTNLRCLSVRKNYVKSIKALLFLDKLESIDLSINRLTSEKLMIDIRDLKQNVGKCGNTCLKIWPCLHTLRLGFNQIKDIEVLFACIDQFSGLDSDYNCSSLMTNVDLANNNIQQFPKSIFNWMNSLQILDLSNNDLNQIPPELGLMTKLNGLKLDGNRLRSMQRMINCGNTSQILNWLKNRIHE